MSDYRIIPSIEQLRQRPRVAALEQDHGASATIDALRQAANSLRQAIASGDHGLPSDHEAAASHLEAHAAAHLATQFKGSLRPVINATGVILHTNLGRAPLAKAALDRLLTIAGGYSNLEYDISKGERGSRTVHAESLLTTLVGAEAAVVVNNNAAATMLILAALASGREVVVSRGELVEIGGGFRVPDVMAQSGAVLREVGTTNRTRTADYRAAIGPKTALLLRVHPSNFRVEGFTERPDLGALVATAKEAAIPLVEDLGSGCLSGSMPWEPTVQSSIAAGVDLVCFSGDKLLGGPQAGIIAGKREFVDRLRRHPLMRALRVDKLTLAALEGTLLEYAAGRAVHTVPTVQMISLDADVIEARVRTMAEALHASGWKVGIVSGTSAIGGGSGPGVELPTVLLTVADPAINATTLVARLRSSDPPIIARIDDDQVVLDLRTVLTHQDAVVIDALRQIR